MIALGCGAALCRRPALLRLPAAPLTGRRCCPPLSTSPSSSSSSRALVLLEDLRELPRAPRPALLLGAAGLLPFAAAPLLMVHWGVFSAPLLHAQLAYGATILAFLGGVRWGASLPADAPHRPDWPTLTMAVSPQLVAWTALVAPAAPGALLVISGLAVAAYWDILLPGYPGWFKALRFCLSVGAILAMWTALMCKWLLPADKAGAAVARPVDGQ